MDEENKNEIIDECLKEEKKENLFLKIILAILMVVVMISTAYLFIPFLILWIVMKVKKLHLNGDFFWSIYNLAFKIYLIILLVLLVAVGGCFFVLFSL